MKKNVLCIFSTLLCLLSCDAPLLNKPLPVQFTNLSLQDNQNPEHLIYIDEDYSRKIIELSNSQKDIITISLKKNHLTPVLVYSSNLDFQPVGCVYPISTYIDEHGGFTAWILYRLIIASHEDKRLTHEYLSHFNWQRFISYIKKYENPWILNQDLIIENIADKTFNVYSIKELQFTICTEIYH